MDRQQRIDLILDHYQNPRHRGQLVPADVVHHAGNPGCGDEVTVYLRLNGDGSTAQMAFQGQGCTISQAAASMAFDMVQGWSLEQIDAASAQPILDMLGPDIASSRTRCATLGLNALKEAAAACRRARSVKEH